jgi:hypothetical protein
MSSTELAIASNKALAKAAEEEGGDALGTLLKFNKGRYYKGDDEIAPGREYTAYVDQWVRGWVKFQDNKPTERKVGKAVDNFLVPDRDELGDDDPRQWEKDGTGKPRDPWSRQSYLPLEDAESGEYVVFVSSSQGGRSAVASLCSKSAQNPQLGRPRVRLGVRSYKHREFGRIQTPDFIIVGWTDEAVTPPKTMAEELNDEIGF